MKNTTITLSSKYEKDSTHAYMTGTQAVVRALLEQRWLDEENGLNTAGYVTGYRGSPMTAMDVQLWREEKRLTENQVKFWPATNENFGMTSIWGTQQIDHHGDANYDGVFSMWYGKGPGVDQTIDGLRQGNWHGTAKNGGVLVLAGDDPNMASTVNNYHSELLFEDLYMPVLYPADIQEVLDLAPVGIALSRFSGCYVGYKLLPETIETAARVETGTDRFNIITPEFDFPEDGVNSRLQENIYGQEERMKRFKLPAALAFSRANNLNKVSHDCDNAKIGIVAMGKIWRDTLQSLTDLGLDEAKMQEMGIKILKVSMPYPVDLETYKEFAKGLEHVFVVEDKREVLERGIREACYDLAENQRPQILGRTDKSGQILMKKYGVLTIDDITIALAKVLTGIQASSEIDANIAAIKEPACKLNQLVKLDVPRLPYFCSGCPHSSSTVTPEGSRSFAGVGCHYMATWMDRDVSGYTHMGAEGSQWIGLAPFVKTKHMFQQLGEGTYYHSGSLAIRAAVAAGTNITYKILYNDATAMTGGQPIDGPISVNSIIEQVRAEGVKRVSVVTDEPEKYKNYKAFPQGTTVDHRDDLIAVQEELREIEGVSVLIYDQTCASEKRRRRKRGKFPDPAKRQFINDRVCEGCGDCGEKSNCLSVEPKDTEFGRKREINQSTCNKDYRCNDGFCPSFVTVLGGKVRKGQGLSVELPSLSDVTPYQLNETDAYSVLITGVGGTGVITVGQLLGMAAHIDGISVSVVDQLGFAQKGGPVKSHVKFAKHASSIKGVRLSAGKTDLLLACDMLAGSDDESLHLVSEGRTFAVVNNHKSITGEFVRDGDKEFPVDIIKQRLEGALGKGLTFIEATKVATALMGDAIAANLFVVGVAFQQGLIPVSEEALLRAIELNGVAVDFNKQAFSWGRVFVDNQQAVLDIIASGGVKEADKLTLAQRISLRNDELTAYQNKDYAAKYQSLISKVQSAETRLAITDDTLTNNALTEAVALYAYKLMSYKDEYEVARLYASSEFTDKLNKQFEGDFKLEFNLAPPMIAPKDKRTGLPRKIKLGGWMLSAFGLLAKFKGLRGTAFDIFGKTAERKMERTLRDDYLVLIENLLAELNADNYAEAVALANSPKLIKGYGHVKERHVETYFTEQKRLKINFKHGDLVKDAGLKVVNS